MSKRAGEFITLDELLAEIGVDAARWFFASRSATTGIDFDIELAKKQSNENPVYYVQYAHARIASILRKAAGTGLAPAAGVTGSLAGAPEAALARAIARFPEVVEDAVTAEETHGITAYATELATTFHGFYRDARVVDAGCTGALGGAACPRRRGPDHAGQRPRRCSGSPPPNRCSRPATGPSGLGQAPVAPKTPSSAWSVASSDASRIVTRFAVDSETRPLSGRAVDGGVGGVRELGGVLLRVPGRVEHDAPGTVGPSTTARRSPPQPAAAAVASPLATPASRSQIPSWNSPNVSWSGTDQPAPETGREVGRERHRDRRLAGRCTCRRGGSARSTRASGRTAHRPPASHPRSGWA